MSVPKTVAARILVLALQCRPQQGQRDYRDALSELESELNCEIEGESVGDFDVDSLIALAESEKSNS